MATPQLAVAPAPGRMGVDFEERVDFARLRGYRLDRARARAGGAASLGALLVFDNNNIRYLDRDDDRRVGPGQAVAATRC